MESQSWKILVVDDHPDLLDRISLTLESEGYTVITAGEGQEALDILNSQHIDLILSDIAMPRMNGYQFYDRVRENIEWTTIAFVFLTARGMDSDIRYGKEIGADDYLSKPIQPEDLLAVVKGQLTRKLQIEQAFDSSRKNVSPEIKVFQISTGELRVESGEYRAALDSKPLQLSAMEFQLLDFLTEQANIIISFEDLVQVTHGSHIEAYEASDLLRPLIRTLRRKLGAEVGDMGCIENIRSIGYRFIGGLIASA